jgi:hypothetical protein
MRHERNEMVCGNSARAQRTRRSRAVWRLAVGTALVLVLVGWHFRYHLLWHYQASRLDLRGTQAVPNRPMPVIPTPDGWVACRVGHLEFLLPRELADGDVLHGRDGVSVRFQHGSRIVNVSVPVDAGDPLGLLAAAARLSPGREHFTMPKLRRACYAANSHDFRWSMTPAQVRWHTFRIVTAKLIRNVSDGYTESYSRQDMDAIVHFTDDRAMLDWQCSDGSWGGYILFVERPGKIEPGWIRAVCESIRIHPPGEAEDP